VFPVDNPWNRDIISGFSPQVQVILRAMKKYGMFLADNGSAFHVSGAPDSRWDDNDLRNLSKLHGSDFEVVQLGAVAGPWCWFYCRVEISCSACSARGSCVRDSDAMARRRSV